MLAEGGGNRVITFLHNWRHDISEILLASESPHARRSAEHYLTNGPSFMIAAGAPMMSGAAHKFVDDRTHSLIRRCTALV